MVKGFEKQPLQPLNYMAVKKTTHRKAFYNISLYIIMYIYL